MPPDGDRHGTYDAAADVRCHRYDVVGLVWIYEVQLDLLDL